MRVETRRLHHPSASLSSPAIGPRDERLDTEAAFRPLWGFLSSLLLFLFFFFPLALPPSLSFSIPPSLSPASQTPYTRQAGKRRLMQSDRHADGHRDTCGCGQVAGETQGQVGADTVEAERGWGVWGGLRAAEVSRHQHTDIWMKQTASLIRGRRRSCPSRTGLGRKQVITPEQRLFGFHPNARVCKMSTSKNWFLQCCF